ncbi:MAG: energy-coupling factor ABC transporter permease [Elusimicrobiota bacterium]|nr:energy-coupling factor ABC transporter permease [Elusimicrobiota bacterium]
MHIPDGFLNTKLAAGLLAGGLAVLGFCLSKVLKAVTVLVGALAGNDGNSKMSLGRLAFSQNSGAYFRKLALIAIWVFAAQMFNIPIQSATSAHLIGGVFAAILVGPFAGFVIISSVLIVQSLFFGDGGVYALGANIVNMAFIGSFLSFYIYKALAKRNYYAAVLIACSFSVLAAALLCLVEVWISGTISFGEALKDMMSLHAVFALLETAITLILVKAFRAIEGEDNE